MDEKKILGKMSLNKIINNVIVIIETVKYREILRMGKNRNLSLIITSFFSAGRLNIINNPLI